MHISYNWLQNYFDEKLPEPEKIGEGIIFHSFEVEDIEKIGNDTIFDIKILPDRAHDCLSHFGIAKEISAIFDIKLKGNYIKEQSLSEKETELKIEIQSGDCSRYMGRVIRNIKVCESPDWLKDKLNAIGQKSINNVVDSANFVMYDLGQPIHSFDLDKLTSSREQVVSIKVRNAKKGEKITTLDKREVELNEDILIIADDKDPLAIAGIKGGTKAEVDNNTKNIVIEVANFNPITTRKTSKKINILTDAVKRYENEISPELCEITMNKITEMIYKLSGGEIESVVDIYPKKAEQKIVTVSRDYINKRLGSNFQIEEIKNVWKKLNFEFTKGEEKGGNFKIKIPFLRIDLTGPHDLVEEVGRIIGYEKIEGKLPEFKKNDAEGSSLPMFFKMALVRQKLLDDGYSEVMTYAFRDKGEVEVLASASDKKFLRNNLSDGLKESIKLNQLNLPLLDQNEVKVFEIGTVFLKDKEQMNVAFGDKKGVTEMTLEQFLDENKLRASPELPLESTNISLLGNSSLRPSRPAQVSPKEVPATHDNTSKKHTGSATQITFKPWSIYPFITRDIAVWVPSEIKPETLSDIYKDLGTNLLVKEPKLFDSFTKDGKTSYAYRLVFQSDNRTLTDEEINKIMSEITEKIISLNWKVR